jgi:integrase
MAAKRDFTDRFLKSIKPAPTGKRVLHLDAQSPGFGIRVTDNSAPGSIGSFVLVARFPGSDNPTARRIGDYPSMSLAQAREIARGWRDDIRSGVDPKVKLERQKAEEARSRTQIFKAVFEQYAAERLVDLRSGTRVEAAIVKHVYPVWEDRPLKDIKRRDAKELVDKIAKTAPIAANRVLAYLSAFGRWAEGKFIIEESPFLRIARPTQNEKDRARDRTLCDTELRTFWQATGELGIFGKAFRVMLLTGQRRTEVGAMRWSELDLQKKIWTLPAARSKNKRVHLIPLSDAVVDIIDSTSKLSGSAFVFSTGTHRTGDNTEIAPISGWGKSKAALDAKMREITGGDVEEFHLHDLRRTCATGLARLKVERVVQAAVLNHTDASVTATYDRWAYLDEKRAALDRWATHLAGIVNGTGDNVVSLAAARG